MPEFAVGVRRGTAFFKICLKNGFRLWQEKNRTDVRFYPTRQQCINQLNCRDIVQHLTLPYSLKQRR